MPAAILPWNVHAGTPHSYGASAYGPAFDDIATLIGGFSHWSVIASDTASATFKYLLIAPNVGTGRLVLWWSSITVPTTVVPYGARNLTYIYATYSPSSVENVPQGNATSVPVLAAADAASMSISGAPSGTANARWHAAENAEQIMLSHASTANSGNMLILAGLAVIDEDGESAPFLSGCGVSIQFEAGWEGIFSIAAGTSNTAYNGSFGRFYAADPLSPLTVTGFAIVKSPETDAWQLVGKMNGVHSFNLESNLVSRKYFIPYLLHNHWMGNYGPYRLRQIAYGPRADHGTAVYEAGTGNVLAQAFNGGITPSNFAPYWCTNFQP